MAGPRTLTDEQIDEMASLRERGLTYTAIGDRFGLSGGAIRWQCLRVGADSPRGHRLASSCMPMVCKRGSVIVRRFTPAEDAAILEQQLQGKRTSEIARSLGRRPNSVLGRAMTLAMHQDRAERKLPVPV